MKTTVLMCYLGALLPFFLLVWATAAEPSLEQSTNVADQTADKETESSPVVEPSPSDDVFMGEAIGRAIVIAKRVDQKEEKKVYIVGKVSAEDETKLDALSLAELKRLGRKRLEVAGDHSGDVESLNGKMVRAKGKISFSQMSIVVDSVEEVKPETPAARKSVSPHVMVQETAK